MEQTSYIALSRQTGLVRQMEVIANNIANSATAGFKGEHMLFAEHLAQAGADRPISYVEDVAVLRSNAQGDLVHTANPFDLALQGKGWLVVETPAGERYTRGGTFQLDAEGRVVTTQGHRLLDEAGGELRIPAEAGTITVTRDGTLSADGLPLARLRLVEFDDDHVLRKTMSGLFTTDLPPQPAREAQVMQGMVERANVQSMIEMTRMMDLMRQFQATQKMIDGEHERLTRAIRTLPDTQSA